MLSNEKLVDVIKQNIGNVNLEDANIPIAMVATDITSGEKVILLKGDVEIAVMASTCIPGIFIPVEIDHKLLVDGGIVENVPVSPLKSMGAEFIISVDLYAEQHDIKPENIVEVLLRTYVFSVKAATKSQTEKADIQIKLDLSEFNMVDINQSDELIHIGYVEAKKALSDIRRKYLTSE